MHLTQWTDYSLRVLMYCAVTAERSAPATISEIARTHDISRAHLTKIVMTLAELGLIKTTRGRGGGLRLMKPAAEITIGEVVRKTEKDMVLVECFDAVRNTCCIDDVCRLKAVLRRGLAKFMAELDGVTLAEVVAGVRPGAVARVPLPAIGRPARRKS